MKVSVVGAGRMGLPLACVLAENGAITTVCDINPDIVDAVRAGKSPYCEPGLDSLIEEMRTLERLDATTSTTAAAMASDVIIVIVPAHLTPEKKIDYSILLAASAAVGKGLRRNSLVIYETTVSVGGTRHVLIPALEAASGLKAGHDFDVAFSPERVKANLVLSRLKSTTKVVGGVNDESRTRAAEFYRTYLQAPVDDVGALEAAELVKLAGMVYRDVNIALANELASYSETVGVDFDRVRLAANTDGEANLLVPGIGVGGHCTPVYPYFLTVEANQLGVAQHLAQAGRAINDRQPKRHIDRLARQWRPLKGRNVHILGLGFRPDVKVEIFSPAFALQQQLEEYGAIVTLEDPYYSADEIRQAGFTPAHAGMDWLEAVILNTAHTDYSHPDFRQWRMMGVEAVVDGRNLWRREDVETAGMMYFGVGRALLSSHCAPMLSPQVTALQQAPL